MTAAQFRAFLRAQDLTQGEVAEMLGYTIRRINGYANGEPIPKVVELALKYLSTTKS